MKSHQISRKASILILINWIVFLACFAWTSRLQSNLLWWRDLNWSSWIEDLGGIAQLTSVPAGTFWILWLLLTIFFSIVSWSRKPAVTPSEEASAPITNRQLIGNAEMLEKHPELKEKLLRLHRSLDNI